MRPRSWGYYEEISAKSWGAEGAEWSEASGDAGWGDGAEGSGVEGSVPTGVLVSTHDVTVRRWAERDHQIVRWTELDRGGHFLAMEQPGLLVDDVRAFFRQVR